MPGKLKQLHSWAAEVCRQTVEPALYTLGIHAYAGAVRCAALRLPKARRMIDGHKEIFSRLKGKVDSWQQPVIWVHAASLGEFEQGRPLMEEIRRRRPEAKIVLTFFSPSGYDVRCSWQGADAVVYLPFDTPRNVRRFLDIVRPEKAIFIKYEFWRNYLHELWRRHIPTYLVSAVFRPDQAFFKRRSAWYRHWLRLYSHIYVQDQRSRTLLAGVGIDNVTVAGDTRFDRVTDIMSAARPLPVVDAFVNGTNDGTPVFIAGSSWPADEEVYAPWVKRHGIRAIIAPHEFDTARIDRLRQLFPGAVLYTEAEANPAKAAGASTLIMNCFGVLSSAYRYADIAYVGGGFGAGLHNINEAAVYGIPVIYGPNNAKFIEARELAEAGGGFPLPRENASEIMERIATPLLDADTRQSAGKRAADYIRSKLGATTRICNDLF